MTVLESVIIFVLRICFVSLLVAGVYAVGIYAKDTTNLLLCAILFNCFWGNFYCRGTK